MTPASPVSLKHTDCLRLEVTYAKDQPQYLPLPVLLSFTRNRVTTRWRLTWRERLRVLWTGNVWHQALTFGQALQPVKLSATEPSLKDLT